MELTHAFVWRSQAAITLAAILALTLALSVSAVAHDLDCHGMPFPQAEKLGCCGAGDAHFADASQFYEDEDGFWHFLVAGEDLRIVRGMPENMIKIEPLPSADGSAALLRTRYSQWRGPPSLSSAITA
jgi:hypothetical protein